MKPTRHRGIMMRFNEKNILVTGGAAGLGQVIAREMAREGGRIFIADINPSSETKEIVKEAGGEAEGIICDVSSEESVGEMVREAGKYFDGKIDVLVNNAGRGGKVQLVKDMDLAEWDKTLRVNLTGTMLVCREVIPHMIKCRSGNIVNISSNVGRRGLPYRAEYVCSKWALLGFTQTLALELAEYGVRVNAVCPGPITGDSIERVMLAHAEAEGYTVEEIRKEWSAVPMKRFDEPEEIAQMVMFLCSDASSAMTGQALNATCGLIMT